MARPTVTVTFDLRDAQLIRTALDDAARTARRYEHASDCGPVEQQGHRLHASVLGLAVSDLDVAIAESTTGVVLIPAPQEG